MEDKDDGQNLIKGAYKVTKSMAETKSTITIPDDEEDVSLKFVVILVNTKMFSKDSLQAKNKSMISFYRV